MVTTLIFIIVLGVLIFVHELGHFLLAKWFGIRVDAFKIGFGPKIVSWRPRRKDGSRGETEYGINLIPFGGYVKIYGETPEEESDIKLASSPSFIAEEHARSMINKPRYQQIVVLAGGVLFNFLFAMLLYMGLFAYGVTATTDGFPAYTQYMHNPRIMITQVVSGSPAEKAGITDGDVIRQIATASSTEVASTSVLSIDSIQQEIDMSGGTAVALTIDHEGETKQIVVSPTKGIVDGKYAIGIAMNEVNDMRLPMYLAVTVGGQYAWQTFDQTVVGLYHFFAQLFHGQANLGEVTGPVGIAGIVGDAARLGISYLLMITALISINLAVINLIPFPALDGGRILFVLIESIIRRRIPASFANWTNLIGFSLLMILMIVVTYHDVMRLITG